MDKKIIIYGVVSSVAIFSSACFLTASERAVIDNPYGVCAHVSHGEFRIVPSDQYFPALRNAGVNWVRTDFDWASVEKREGEWNYNHLDDLVVLSKNESIDILPILNYSVPWARPAWKNLDKWSEYVQRTVSRYSDDLRFWEVWNEQNYSFWDDDKPDAANYAILLKRTYEEIKKIDPELTVLYGGTSGVPLSFIAESLRSGAGDYFDVMNVHPYNWDGVPEDMISQIQRLRRVMTQYGVGHKPIWITEVGWSTARPKMVDPAIMTAVFKEVGVDPSQESLTLVKELCTTPVGRNYVDGLPKFQGIKEISFEQIKKLEVKNNPVLIPTMNEAFPAGFIPDLIDYVKRGGTILLPSGLPFYYDLELDDDGEYRRKHQINERYMKDFHIGWETWWTHRHVPSKATWRNISDRFSGGGRPESGKSVRFLHDRNLAPGDEFIPIVEAGDDTYDGVIAAIYKLNSDLKGNVIVFTDADKMETVSEEKQGEMLPRTYLVSLASGVDKVFWYNFRSGEWSQDEREAHFGIVRKNLEPKPAFRAFQVLTALIPSGSTVPMLGKIGNVYQASWTRPDGVNIWAFWTADGAQPIKLKFSGEIRDVFNHIGESQNVSSQEYMITSSVLYFVGPDVVSIE